LTAAPPASKIRGLPELPGNSVPSRAARWRVLIVEDSPMVAALHCRVVDAQPLFSVVEVAKDELSAYRAARQSAPDLAIVDLAIIGGSGLSLLRKIRGAKLPIEVIVVTASQDPATVRDCMHLGVVDYLVKPFAPERLQESLTAFARREKALRRPQLTQDDVDVIQASCGSAHGRLPRGLRRSTLQEIGRVLRGSAMGVTADEVATDLGVARVTARRYLEYLEVIGVAQMVRDHGAAGRPRTRYRAIERTALRG
jgi:two-component system response regulator DctR